MILKIDQIEKYDEEVRGRFPSVLMTRPHRRKVEWSNEGVLVAVLSMNDDGSLTFWKKWEQ